MNKERDSRNEKKLEEFVLVKNDKTPIFRETDVNVKPIVIGKDGIEFEILDKDNKRIGFVRGDKTFEFDKAYKKELQNSMGKLYEFLGFDTEKLKFDVMAKIKEQEQQMQIEKLNNLNKDVEKDKDSNKQNDNVKDDISQEKNQDSVDKTNNNNSGKISLEDLEKQGINAVGAVSIDDPLIKDSMITSSNINPNSITVVDLGANNFEIFVRENGTGNIIQLNERAGGKENSSEEVNIIENNEERTTNAGTTKIMPDFGNMEFSIKNVNGTIKVSVLDNIDERGNREIVGVDTSTKKTTMEEYNRRKDESLDKYDEPSPDSILTIDEMEERISKIRNPIVKEMVQDRVKDDDNCTKEQLENIIDDCDEEYSRDNHEPQLGDRSMRH